MGATSAAREPIAERRGLCCKSPTNETRAAYLCSPLFPNPQSPDPPIPYLATSFPGVPFWRSLPYYHATGYARGLSLPHRFRQLGPESSPSFHPCALKPGVRRSFPVSAAALGDRDVMVRSSVCAGSANDVQWQRAPECPPRLAEEGKPRSARAPYPDMMIPGYYVCSTPF
jgi:hypothetical protein